MGDKNIYIIRNQFFRMVITQPEKHKAIDSHATILQKMHALRQVLNRFGIPQTKVMIAHHEDFLPKWLHNKPVEEIENLGLSTIFGDVTTMYEHVGWRQRPQPTMQPMRVTDVKNGHISYLLRRKSSSFPNMVILQLIEIFNLFV